MFINYHSIYLSVYEIVTSKSDSKPRRVHSSISTSPTVMTNSSAPTGSVRHYPA